MSLRIRIDLPPAPPGRFRIHSCQTLGQSKTHVYNERSMEVCSTARRGQPARLLESNVRLNLVVSRETKERLMMEADRRNIAIGQVVSDLVEQFVAKGIDKE